MIKENLLQECPYIFFDLNKLSKDEITKREVKGRKTIKNNPWTDVFDTWFEYLKSSCKTEEEIINFISVYWAIQIPHCKKLPLGRDPYDFIGYLLAKIDVNKYEDFCNGIVTPIAIDVLGKSWENDAFIYYDYWNDPKVIEASKKYK